MCVGGVFGMLDIGKPGAVIFLSQTLAGDELLCLSGSLALLPKTPLFPTATGALREFHGGKLKFSYAS